ncbi:hypothetical protein SUGI_0989090 [Cryptomeria japonica]|nr:hypothetical protein SUGI_0989090 [Cryptomeria japonica]
MLLDTLLYNDLNFMFMDVALGGNPPPALTINPNDTLVSCSEGPTTRALVVLVEGSMDSTTIPTVSKKVGLACAS